jgi:hypothetical protein
MRSLTVARLHDIVNRINDSCGVSSAVLDLRLRRALLEFERLFGDADPVWIAAAMRIPKNAEILANCGPLSGLTMDEIDGGFDSDFDLEPPCEPHRTIFDVRQLELKL